MGACNGDVCWREFVLSDMIEKGSGMLEIHATFSANTLSGI